MPQYIERKGAETRIAQYEFTTDSIRVQYQDTVWYEWRASEVGAEHISNMTRLAEAGCRLGAYIDQHVKYRHSVRW
jgi:hypothetical protein